jgi:hypothetical protein
MIVSGLSDKRVKETLRELLIEVVVVVLVVENHKRANRANCGYYTTTDSWFEVSGWTNSSMSVIDRNPSSLPVK